MIAQLPKEYDLFLGYSWGVIPQGVCGHVFECIEYYHILKEHFKVGIFLCEDTPKEIIIKSVKEKYDFTEQEIDELLSDIFIYKNPTVLKGNNLLLVDGNFQKLKNKHLLFNNIFAFPCNILEFPKNVTVLGDNRIYGEGKFVNYVKKILFDRYKTINNTCETNLIYTTSSCRKFSESEYKKLEKQYENNFIVLTDDNHILSNRFTLLEMPVENLFEKFDTYIYTPVERKRDCSPRFIAECKWYNKKVIYHDIDYLEEDKGLFWRKHDIETNFNNISLKKDDEIINLIKERL